METSVRIGKNAENQAIAYLMANGYEVVATNYRSSRNEIDIIAKSDLTLVFVEVKYRKNSTFGHPETFLSEQQETRIGEAAESYMREKDWQGPIRFDVISIEGNGSLTHLEDAF